MNIVNFKSVLDQIEAHPELWDQTNWHASTDCGTAHCFAGWAQVLSGKEEGNYMVREDAMKWLALSEGEACYLFSVNRTIEDFEWFYRQNLPLEVLDLVCV